MTGPAMTGHHWRRPRLLHGDQRARRLMLHDDRREQCLRLESPQDVLHAQYLRHG
jgi:hypothetical protein